MDSDNERSLCQDLFDEIWKLLFHTLHYASELLVRGLTFQKLYLFGIWSCYCKKQIDISFLCAVVLLKIDNVMTKFDRRIKNFPIWEAI